MRLNGMFRAGATVPLEQYIGTSRQLSTMRERKNRLFDAPIAATLMSDFVCLSG